MVASDYDEWVVEDSEKEKENSKDVVVSFEILIIALSLSKHDASVV